MSELLNVIISACINPPALNEGVLYKEWVTRFTNMIIRSTPPYLLINSTKTKGIKDINFKQRTFTHPLTYGGREIMRKVMGGSVKLCGIIPYFEVPSIYR